MQGIVSLARLQLPGLLPRAAEIFTDRKMPTMKIHLLVLTLLFVFVGTIVPALAEKPVDLASGLKPCAAPLPRITASRPQRW